MLINKNRKANRFMEYYRHPGD